MRSVPWPLSVLASTLLLTAGTADPPPLPFEVVATLGAAGRLPDRPIAVAYSPDGKRLATGGAGRAGCSVCLLDAATMRLQAVLPGHLWAIVGIGFAPDGQTLASADLHGTLRLWDLRGPHPRERAVWNHPKYREWHFAFTPDSRTLITADGSNTLHFWDLTRYSPRLGHTWKSPAPVHLVAVSGDGRTLAAAGAISLRLWDLSEAPPKLRVVEERAGLANCLAFTSDGRRLATGYGVNVSVPGLVGPMPGMVQVWEVAPASLKPTALLLGGDNDTSVYEVAFSADGKTLLAGCTSGRIHIWNVAAAETKAICTLKDCDLDSASTATPSFALAPDGQTLATVGREDQYIRLWDLRGGQPRQVFPARAEPWLYRSVAVAPDGKTMATWRCRLQADGSVGSGQGQVQFWDVRGRVPTERASFPLDDTRVHPFQFGLAGRLLLADSRKPPGILRLFDVAGPRPSLHTELQTRYLCLRAAFGRQGLLAVANSYDTIELLDLKAPDAAQKPVLEVSPKESTECLAFSPDGTLLVSGHAGGVLRLWQPDGREWTLTGKLQTGASKVCIAFAPTGKTLACMGFLSDDVVGLRLLVWDLSGPRPVLQRKVVIPEQGRRWGRREGGLGFHQLVLTAHGRRAVVGLDGDLLVLDTQTGQRLYQPQFPSRPRDIVFSADGRLAAAVHDDGTISLLRLPYTTDAPPRKPK
jgi:WD40 repeat protein